MTREQINEITKQRGAEWVEKRLPRVLAALRRAEGVATETQSKEL